MATHNKASLASRSICDLLLSLVKREIKDSSRKEAKECCSIGVKTRFAYAYHRRGGLRVYLYGEEADGPELTLLARDGPVKVLKRKTMANDWAQLSPYYMELDSEREVNAALPLLLYAANRVETKSPRTYLLPSEVSAREMIEGSRIDVQVSRIERDPGARKKCIQIFGSICVVCGFDFEAAYGNIGCGFIHVHHLNPLAAASGQRKVDPKTDLRPVCPNCHEMLHRQSPPFTIEELRMRISGSLKR